MANIELTDLKKTFGKGERAVHAVDGINLTIGDGEFVSMVGRSGSGKTTTLDCLGLLMRPTSGKIVIDGLDTSTLSGGKRADFRSRMIGFIFQGFNLLPSLNALDNVMLPLRYSRGDKKAARQRAQDLFEEIGMADRMHHRPTQLSGGEQQRVAIARALINQPTLVLGDEPTGEVDTETSQKLIALMRRLNRETGVTFVLVTHDFDLASRTDRLVRIKDGRVISDERQTARTDAAPTDVADMAPVTGSTDDRGEPIAAG
ncbi:MAG TPA: ABC transporter ATP-binding protein [Candidatus Dormibacteraeota bacterium]|jgi:ABC-type lipoprotein export system ATPase subunit|nr:ABC transporter ATP-binding protein [Candidatus Dormibacteraeota bacterium]